MNDTGSNRRAGRRRPQASHSVRILAAIGAGISGLYAQNFDPLTAAGIQRGGIHLYSVSANTGYNSVDNSAIEKLFVHSTADTLPNHSTSSGATAVLGFHKSSGAEARSTFS